MYTKLSFKIGSKFKKKLCKHRVILISNRIWAKKWVYAEFFNAFFLKDSKSFVNLLGSHTVFSIARIIHNIIGNFENSSGIIAATHFFRQFAASFFNCLDMCNIIKIDDTAELITISKLVKRGIIWWKHNIITHSSDGFSHHKFCFRWAVTTATIFTKNID